LAATLRAGIYRARPHHEQTRWLLRIRAEKDLETLLLQVCSDPPDPETGPASMLPDEISGKKMVSAAERHRVRRRFKGLDEQAFPPRERTTRRFPMPRFSFSQA
jgi:hypothetical protein